MNGIISNINQGKLDLRVENEIKSFKFKQTKKNSIKSNDLKIGLNVNIEINPLTNLYEVKEILGEVIVENNDKVMVIMSTGNQTVNVMPIRILDIDKTYILSTKFAKDKWTDRLVHYLEKKNKKYEIVDISPEEEMDVNKLQEKIMKIVKDKKNCYLNITGGQKFYTSACERVIMSNEDIKRVYIDGHSKKIYVDNDYKNLKCDFNLENILNIYGYTHIKEDTKTWELNNSDAFRLKKYYNIGNRYIKESEISNLLLEKKSVKQNEIYRFYNNLDSLYRQKSCLDKELLLTFESLYSKFNCHYKEQIKQSQIESSAKSQDFQIKKLMNVAKINSNDDKDLFGEIINHDKGSFFEKMVLAQIMNILEKDNELKQRVTKVYTSVKTLKLQSEKGEIESEYDIVILTNYGTLIILEVKTGVYNGDHAKGKEYGAITKSGPYGKSVIVGPLVSRLKSQNDKLSSHKKVCEQIGIPYLQFDELHKGLKKLLK